MDAEFEEKEFEGFLNQQLCAHAGVFWPPGQVLENIIGIDAALVCHATEFWKLFPPAPPGNLYPTTSKPSGIVLNTKYWTALEGTLDKFPPISFNLFVQHKRPSYLIGESAEQWEHWKQPYYRYPLNFQQQNALSHLAKIAQADALVVYSCPAFVSRNDLWRHGLGTSLIENTNFALAENLDSHHHYTFVGPGSTGYACSEPAEIPSFSLLEAMQSRRGRERSTQGNREFIHVTAKQVMKAVEAAGLGERFQSLFEFLPRELPAIAKSVFTVHTFCIMVNTKWYLAKSDFEEDMLFEEL